MKHLPRQNNCNRFTTEVKKEEWTHLQSPELKRVDLTVSTHKFKHYKMFGTLTEKKDGDYQDPCSGDSGGPLMYQMKNSRRWVIIGQFRLYWNDIEQTFENPGTVFGSGFDCRTGKVYTFERQTDGMWNKVQQNIDFKGQDNLNQTPSISTKLPPRDVISVEYRVLAST